VVLVVVARVVRTTQPQHLAQRTLVVVAVVEAVALVTVGMVVRVL
jgi:hypothetical protein